ncbi:MAG: fimbrial protein [Ralstonia sp.]|jgi:major type 1 subunit fimbrin (pilin)|uniref:fimbrial protein n=2 Tax=Ralstonia TaxID=48736 RepID=UPI0039786E70
MKKLAMSLIGTATLATLGAMPAAAQASDGTITFKGTVAGTSCTISVDGGGASNTVTLPTVQTGSLASAGTTAGARTFTIGLTKCAAGEGAKVAGAARAFFEMGSNVDDNGRLNNIAATSPAGNVQVELLDASSNVINIGNASQRVDGAQKTSIVDGAATMTYQARYYATAAASAGDVETSVTYSVDYL